MARCVSRTLTLPVVRDWLEEDFAMWADFSGKAYSRDGFLARLDELRWSSWAPEGIILHNTAAPTLAQWAESGPAHEQRIKNLQQYYEGMGWHGGPHWFVSRHWINEFSNPLRRGTHSPSFNATHFGIEMVGDFAREPFNSGDGALVRDNAVFVMAALCHEFDWDPTKAIKLHKEDKLTNHDCPGKFVVKADVIARVVQEMLRQAGKPSVSIPDRPDGEPSPPPTWKAPDHPAFSAGAQKNIIASVFGYAGDEGHDRTPSAYGGWVNPDVPECALPARIRPPKKRHPVRVTNRATGKSVMCELTDVGPWTSKTGEDPYWETITRPKSETTPGTNKAAIDLTPAAALAIGMLKPGQTQAMGIVDWEFVDGHVVSPSVPPPKPPPTTPTATKVGIGTGLAALLAAIAAWADSHPLLIAVAVALAVASVIFMLHRRD